MKVKTPFEGEKFDQPSLTVPDQTMSMRTLMERYARGLPLDNMKKPLYDVDELSTGVDLRKMDLVDIQEMTMDHKKLIKGHKDKLERKEKQRQHDMFETEVTKRVNNALNKQ